MSAVCEVCGKRPRVGMRVSHSHRRTKRRWNPNIQKIRAVVGGAPEAGAGLHVLPQGGEDPEAGLTAPGPAPSFTPAAMAAVTKVFAPSIA